MWIPAIIDMNLWRMHTKLQRQVVQQATLLVHGANLCLFLLLVPLIESEDRRRNP
jgi:hypothetical protein